MPPKIRGTKDLAQVDQEQALKQNIALMTPIQGERWVEDNVRNMNDVKLHLKRLTRIVLALANDRR